MLRATVLGVVVLVGALGLWGIGIREQVFSESAMLLLFASPGIAAFVSSRTAPRRKFLLGIVQAPLWAALASIGNVAWAVSGRATDFPGGRGTLWLFTLALLGALVPAAAGAGAGAFLGARRRPPPASPYAQS